MEEIHHATFLTSTLSLLVLLLLSCFTYLVSKKIHFPYTVLLVIIGLILVPLSHTEFFGFIDDFKLTPNILFFVFLPILLFESAYNMNYRQLLKNWVSIGTLAVFGLIFSAILIGGGLYFIFPIFGLHIPFIVCLLFGSLISATDPVAVLSIFKTIGAPRRLALIFEGESIFNDGTALALFLVILGIIIEGQSGTGAFVYGTLSFLGMVIGGMIFGIVMGIVFSKILEYVKNDESVEIGITVIVAHLTFVLSELINHYAYIGDFNFKISGVIATALAGITIGNYGRYKISPKVEEYMEKFWGFFAFIANSLVFILLGLILSDINIQFSIFIIPIFVTIIVVMLARAISVYIPVGLINFFKLEEYIPLTWQHLLSWGSLRGALAVMMVLLIPGVGEVGFEKVFAFQNMIGWKYNFSIKDFIMVMTIGSIMFTLFIKATTISFFMKKLGIDKLHILEEFEYEEGKILAQLTILEKLRSNHSKAYISHEEFESLNQKYEKRLHEAVDSLKKLLDGQKDRSGALLKKAFSLHALGIEKQYLKELFHSNEIDEYNFKIIFGKITRQMERIESGLGQLRENKTNKDDYNFLERFSYNMRKGKETFLDIYMRSRARIVITRKVIQELQHLKKINFGFDSKFFDETIQLYEDFRKNAKEMMDHIRKENKIAIMHLESKLADKGLLNLEGKVIHDLYEKEIITPKLYLKFVDEIEQEIQKDAKTMI